MTIDRRGQYVARFTERVSGGMLWRQRSTKWHYVDSQVADAVITYCGRRMPLSLRADTLTFFAKGAPGMEYIDADNLCHVCGKGSLAASA